MIVAHANYLVAQGHQVTIMASRFNSVFQIDDRITLQPLPGQTKGATLLRALRTRFPHQLVITDIIPLACLLSFRNRTQTVYFAQDYDESYYSSPLMQYCIRMLYVLGLSVMKIKTIAVAQHLAETFFRRFHAHAEVVENGIDSGCWYPDPDQQLVQDKHGCSAVLLLSRSDQRKGFDSAVQIIKQLSKHCDEDLLEIWTVGEPCQGLFPGSVHHRDFGYVNEHQLRKIMSSADLLLYPSRHEGLPLMPLEAMACGCPVVTTPAVPYARNGENALVSPVSDTAQLLANVIHILDNQATVQTLISGGFATAEQYSLANAQKAFAHTVVTMAGLQ